MSKTVKRKIAKSLSAALVSTGMTDLYRTLERKSERKKVRILNYHRILDTRDKSFPYYEKNISCSPSIFEKQMRYIKDNFNVFSLHDYVDMRMSGTPIPTSGVIITFDDGYRDVYTNAFPILRKLQIPATFFVAVDFIHNAQINWCDQVAYVLKKTTTENFDLNGVGQYQLKTSKERERAVEEIVDKLSPMATEQRKRIIQELISELDIDRQFGGSSDLYVTREQLREMSENGIEIGAHTLSHPNLRILDNNSLSNEVGESKRQLEQIVQKPVKVFAYPFGHREYFDERVIDAVRQAGFSSACTTIYGSVDESDDIYQLKRIPMFNHDDWYVFKAKVSGVLDSLRHLERIGIRV
jgi:peptidoglycan/xylan/chitin deacetylase (PgdA/CDA1 family)